MAVAVQAKSSLCSFHLNFIKSLIIHSFIYCLRNQVMSYNLYIYIYLETTYSLREAVYMLVFELNLFGHFA